MQVLAVVVIHIHKAELAASPSVTQFSADAVAAILN